MIDSLCCPITGGSGGKKEGRVQLESADLFENIPTDCPGAGGVGMRRMRKESSEDCHSKED